MSLSNLPPGVTDADIERQALPWSGEDLYRLWAARMAEQGVVVDGWGDQPQAAWNALARDLQ